MANQSTNSHGPATCLRTRRPRRCRGGDPIVISGGEVLGTPARLEPAGAAMNGQFYAVGGSTTAGTANDNTGKLFSIQFGP